MIIYEKGDLFLHSLENVIICHICNNLGKWGKGFVMTISKYSKKPEKEYKLLKKYELGSTQYVEIDKVVIANMIAQNGINTKYLQKCRVDYDNLEKCLRNVYEFNKSMNYKIYMPQIGSGLAMGDWNIIENMIDSIFNDMNVYVFIL